MAGIDALLVPALECGVACNQLAILGNPHLCRVVLNLDDPAPGGIRHAVLVAADRDHALLPDPAPDGRDCVARPGRQGREVRPFLGKARVNDALRGGVDPGVGDGRAPILEPGIQAIGIAEAARPGKKSCRTWRNGRSTLPLVLARYG